MSRLPLYERVESVLAGDIADGSLPPESQLPPEEGLIERFKVSRTTGPPACPAADEEARAVGGQAKTEHQQAASRAQGLPVPSARQDDRPAKPGVGSRRNVHTDAARVFVPG